MKFDSKSQQMELIKSNLLKQIEENRRLKCFVDQIKQDGSVLNQISVINENLRRKYQHELQSVKSTNDSFSSHIY